MGTYSLGLNQRGLTHWVWVRGKLTTWVWVRGKFTHLVWVRGKLTNWVSVWWELTNWVWVRGKLTNWVWVRGGLTHWGWVRRKFTHLVWVREWETYSLDDSPAEFDKSSPDGTSKQIQHLSITRQIQSTVNSYLDTCALCVLHIRNVWYRCYVPKTREQSGFSEKAARWHKILKMRTLFDIRLSTFLILLLFI